MSPAEPEIKKLYYSISEVSELTGLKQYVLRYWETEFSVLRPQKNRAGNRIYRQFDIDTVLRIKDLLYSEKYTIEGARRQLKLESSGAVASKGSLVEAKYRDVIKTIKKELQEMLELLSHT